jgi:hypothetical protein
MSKDDQYISFRANNENKNLKQSLRQLAKKADRKLNDYLNIVLARHVNEHNDTNEE